MVLSQFASSNNIKISSRILNYGEFIFFSFLVIFLFVVLILTIFLLTRKINKKISNTSSVIVPLKYDREKQRIRMIDSKFLDDAKSVFKNQETLYSGEWVKIENFVKLFIKRDQGKILENLQKWTLSEMYASLIIKNQKITTSKKYRIFFSNAKESMIIFYLNQYQKFDIDISKELKLFRDKKILPFDEISKTKRQGFFIALKLKESIHKKEDVNKIVDDLMSNNKILNFKIRHFYEFDRTLVIPVYGWNKVILTWKKDKMVKLFQKYQNNYFYNEMAIVYEENIDGPAKIESLKRKISYSLWKSEQSQNTFTFLNLQSLSVFEYEEFIKNLNEIKKNIKNEIFEYNKFPITKNRKIISYLYDLKIDEQVKKNTSKYELKKLHNVFFNNYQRIIYEKNSFIYANEDNFFNLIRSGKKGFIPNIVVKVKNIQEFQKKFLRLEQLHYEQIEHIEWGILIEQIDSKLLTVIKKTEPKFIFISKKVMKHIQNAEVLLFLETIHNLTKTHKIVLFYEESDEIIEEKWEKNIGLQYFYTNKVT